MRSSVVLSSLVTVALTSCPFASEVQIGKPKNEAVDPRPMGYWVWEDLEHKKESKLVEILAFNQTEYLVEVTLDDFIPKRFRVFPIQVGRESFWILNAVDRTFPPTSFCYLRWSITADGDLVVRFVSDKGVPKVLSSDAAGLAAHLESHAADGSLDDVDCTFHWRRPAADEVDGARLKAWTAGK